MRTGRPSVLRSQAFGLFDLRTDPQELRDIGADPDYAEVCARLDDELFAWFRRSGSRITISEQTVKSGDFAALAYDRDIDDGILIGYWDEDELDREFEKRKRYML